MTSTLLSGFGESHLKYNRNTLQGMFEALGEERAKGADLNKGI